MHTDQMTPEKVAAAILATDEPMVGYVWWCGDDYCDCTEARIETNPRQQYETRIELWAGKFHAEGESGAETDLNRMAQALRRHHHDAYTRVKWRNWGEAGG